VCVCGVCVCVFVGLGSEAAGRYLVVVVVFVHFAALVVLAPHANVVADGERFLFALVRSLAVENDGTALAVFAHQTAVLEVPDQGILMVLRWVVCVGTKSDDDEGGGVWVVCGWCGSV
jgi:hypothetical protein